MRACTALLILLSFSSDAATRRRIATPPVPWDATLEVETRVPQTIGTRVTRSSSSLEARWSAPPAAIHHYVLTATETAGGTPLRFTAAAGSTSKVLDALESATEYRVGITACPDAACTRSVAASSTAIGGTDEEVWQIRGTGSSYATAERLVSDGNTKAYALLWGADAGPSLAGRAQLYYDPSTSNEKGVKIGTMSGAITAWPESVASFSPLSGYGFRRNDGQGRMGTGPATFQAVALSARLGAKVRLFYEAADADGHGRVYSVDSRDGWQGRDFHSGTATQCQETDLVAGGACAATLLVGVESDGNPRVREARQLKVGLPTLDRWTWDGETGTFMVVTLHFADSACSSTFFNMGYAVWDGIRWALQYDATGCPKLISGVQAPLPVHLGGVRYKLYFNHNRTGNSNDKPMRLLYADGSTTGADALVDFEDWEPITRARRVNYVWPAGTLLTDQETSMLDDFHIWMPTNDPAFQVIYSNMSCPNNACGPPFIGISVLLNP